MKKHPYICVRVDEDGALSKSADVNSLLVDELRISIETTDGDASWLNGNNEQNNRIIYSILREVLIDSTQHENKCVQKKHQLKYIYAKYTVN